MNLWILGYKESFKCVFAKHFWFLDGTITENSKKNLILYLIFNMVKSHNCNSWVESRPIITN